VSARKFAGPLTLTVIAAVGVGKGVEQAYEKFNDSPTKMVEEILACGDSLGGLAITATTNTEACDAIRYEPSEDFGSDGQVPNREEIVPTIYNTLSERHEENKKVIGLVAGFLVAAGAGLMYVAPAVQRRVDEETSQFQAGYQRETSS